MIDLFLCYSQKKEFLNQKALQHTVQRDCQRKFSHVYKNCHNKASLLSIDQALLSSLAL